MSALELPLEDARGDVLEQLTACIEGDIAVEGPVPCPLALVVVASGGAILFGRNRWRHTWELPGGMIDGGETPREAAARELTEETRIPCSPEDLGFIGRATFALRNPTRREHAAIYRMDLPDGAEAMVTYELTEVAWMTPSEPPRDAALLDFAIARWGSVT